MKKVQIFSIWILVLWPAFACFSQQKLDSLTKALQAHLQEDSTRIMLLYELSFDHWNSNPELSGNYARQALVLAEKIKYQPGLGLAHQAIAIASWAKSDYQTALQHYLESLRIWEQLHNTERIANTLGNIGLLHYALKEYSKALSYTNKSLHTLQSLKPTPKIRENIGDAVDNIGVYYFDSQQSDSARFYFERALALRKLLPDSVKLASSYHNVGAGYLLSKQYDTALSYFQTAMQLWKPIQANTGMTMTLGSMGELYIHLKQYKLAEQYLKESLRIAVSVKATKWIISAYGHLKELETARGDYKQALAYDEQAHMIKDTIFSAEKARQLAELEGRYEKEKKEKEIAQLEKEQAQAQLRFILTIIGFTAILTISLLAVGIQRLRIRKNKVQQALIQAELENEQLKNKELDQQLTQKSQELATYTLHLVQKNQAMEELSAGLEGLLKQAGGPVSQQLKSLSRLVDYSFNNDKNWEEFKRQFEQVHKDFFTYLTRTYPELTSTDLRLCALIKLNLNNKEIASVMGIDPNSVKMARYRLRRKLALGEEENLNQFLLNAELHLAAS